MSQHDLNTKRITDNFQSPNPLGRGLDSLLGPKLSSSDSFTKKEGITHLSTNMLVPGKFQPRSSFSDREMEGLTASIRENGVLQPILVRQSDGTDQYGNILYEIIAGERRWRASTRAGLKSVPVVIRSMSDRQALESGLIENIQRDDLNAIEEAKGYNRLIAEFNYTQEQLAKSIGKSRSHVANTVRLLSLPKLVQILITERKLSAGHARALINCDYIDEAVKEIVDNRLNVRQTEKLVADLQNRKNQLSGLSKSPAGGSASMGKSDADGHNSQQTDDISLIEQQLSSAIGLKTEISLKSDSSGDVKISIKNFSDLDKLLNLFYSLV